MKVSLLGSVFFAALAEPVLAQGADVAGNASWHAQSLGQALGYMLLFGAAGIIAAIVGYKLFDKCTPGDLSREILENKNVAAAMLG